MSFWELLTGKSYKEYESATSADVIAMFPLNKVDKDIVTNLTSKITDKDKMVAVKFLDLLKNIDDKKNVEERKKLWNSYKQAAPPAPAPAPAPAPVVPVQGDNGPPPPGGMPVGPQPGGMNGGGKRKGRKNKTTTKIVAAPAVKRRRRRKTIKVSAAAIDNAKPI